MSQQRILEWLKERYPRKFTAAQIIYHLTDSGELSKSVIYANIQKLKHNKDVYYVEGKYKSCKGRPTTYYWYKKEGGKWKNLVLRLRKSKS